MNRLRRSLFLVVGVLLMCGGNAASAQSITKVEEDWELDLNTPNAAKGSPQLTFVMSPTGTTNSLYSVFVVNQRTTPRGEIGGLQLQVWNGDSLVSSATLSNTSALATEGEKVQWTRRMSISGGVITFEIVSGTSTTWGKFGTKNELVATASTYLSDLNAYDPNVTINNAGIDFGNTRVNKLILRKVRTYTSNKKSVETGLDRVIFQYP